MDDKLRVIGLLSPCTPSEARMAHDAVRSGQVPNTAAGQAVAQPGDFRALLRQLVDEENYPRLYRIAWSARTEEDLSSAGREHEEFLLGVERILDGVQVLVERGRRD
jgi:hypothetical protein